MHGRKRKGVDLTESWSGGTWDGRYLGYFDCFNRQKFYEAHDVLEELWLERRLAPEGNFYKGLIQLAGAFVHLQKGRLGPAAALLRRAMFYLGQYPGEWEGLRVAQVLGLADEWLADLEAGGFAVNPWGRRAPPRLPWPEEIAPDPAG